MVIQTIQMNLIQCLFAAAHKVDSTGKLKESSIVNHI